MPNFPRFGISSVLVPLGFALLVKALDRTSEQGEASISDPVQECTSYSYDPVATQMEAGNFPALWAQASILPGDSAASTKWNSISSSIPTNIAVKSIPPPSNYSSGDPDCWWTFDQCTTPKLASLSPDIDAAPEPSTLGYGFDDGPNCSHNAFYDFLQSQNQKATFYYIGANVANFPLEAQRGLADGHEICVHTWSHPYMTTVASENAFAELWYNCIQQIQMIKLVVGVTPTCWRPPYGDVDDRIRAIANALGLQTIMWKYDTADASVNNDTITEQTVDANYNSFIQTASDGTFDSIGAIILTHEMNNFTMSEAVKFYPQLKNVFQYIVPVGVSLNKTQPYIETNYGLPTFEQYISGTVTVQVAQIIPMNYTSTSVPSSTSTAPSSIPLTSDTSSGSSPSGKSAPTSNPAQSHKVVEFGYGDVLLKASLLALTLSWIGI